MSDPKDPTGPEAKAEPLTTHHFGVLVEMFDRNNKTILEAMENMRESLERKWDERFAEMNRRFDVLEAVVRKNSEDIRKNSEDIALLAAEISQLRKRLARIERRLESPQTGLKALEERVTVIEARLGITRP